MTESALWVDTDFGFDDMWALLLLRHLGYEVAGVSLVFGNTPLNQVVNNACSAQRVFDFNWPLYSGSVCPLKQPIQTAEVVLGQTGMQTRGLRLPKGKVQLKADSACDAFARWLSNGANDHQVLALGPLTNLASFALHSPERFNTIDRICWMGGSAGRGNQTAWAEFNAFADPDAVDVVLSSGVPIDIIDLELCRQVAFAEQHMPAIDATSHTSQTLLRDLLGGYLDIALHRGRESMNIYDPVAVLACVEAIPVEFTPCTIKISLAQGEQLGRTRVTPLASSDNAESEDSLSRPSTRICSAIDSEAARAVCMKALQHPWWE